MSCAPITQPEAAEFLYREALLLDTGDWDKWLALYAEDAVFWMPAWRSELETTRDPDAELSLIYYRGRRNLEDRVWRARSGLSVASAPRARTVHAVTNVLLIRNDAETAEISACFTVHLRDVRADRTHVFFGRYEHRLQRCESGWLIAAKKIVLLNDVIPTVADFYSV
jgi:3-phenylpropionate/cinnamic acid dioxygenase small subunit